MVAVEHGSQPTTRSGDKPVTYKGKIPKRVIEVFTRQVAEEANVRPMDRTEKGQLVDLT